MTARICYVTMSDLIAAAQARLDAAVSAIAKSETLREKKYWMGVARRERKWLTSTTR